MWATHNGPVNTLPHYSPHACFCGARSFCFPPPPFPTTPSRYFKLACGCRAGPHCLALWHSGIPLHHMSRRAHNMYTLSAFVNISGRVVTLVWHGSAAVGCHMRISPATPRRGVCMITQAVHHQFTPRSVPVFSPASPTACRLSHRSRQLLVLSSPEWSKSCHLMRSQGLADRSGHCAALQRKSQLQLVRVIP